MKRVIYGCPPCALYNNKAGFCKFCGKPYIPITAEHGMDGPVITLANEMADRKGERK